MPKPITVWAVELEKEAALEEVRGTLQLADGALVFTPRAEGRTVSRIPLSDVARVRRLRGSPVLMVFHASTHGERRTAFYFAQPPPIGAYIGDLPAERPQGLSLSAFRSPKRKARRDNVGYLGVMNREKKAMLTEWVRAVRAAIKDDPSRPAEG
ncbi:MAG: hypothetical protein WD670_01300, partial [Actinomycetota bacterium]